MTHMELSRRDIIKSIGVSALTVPFFLNFANNKAKAAPALADNNFVSAYIEISSSNKAKIFVGSSEMGQGIMSGIAQIVAEQLNLNWAEISVEHGTPDLRVNLTDPNLNTNLVNPFARPNSAFAITGSSSQSTAASTSTQRWYSVVSKQAAIVREMLILAASEYKKTELGASSTWVMDPSREGELKCTSHTTSNLTYGELAPVAHGYFFIDKSIAYPSAASPLSTRKYVGKPLVRKDIAAKTNGSAKFGIDITKSTLSTLNGEPLENKNVSDANKTQVMYYAAVIHAPKLGGEVLSAPTSAPGVTLIKLRNKIGGPFNAVGVVSPIGTYEAFLAAKSVANQITWTYPNPPALYDSTAIKSKAVTLAKNDALTITGSPVVENVFVVEPVGTDPASARNAFNSSDVKLDRVYSLPNLAHACMEVLNCTALVKDVPVSSGGVDKTYRCEMWASTQAQTSCAKTASDYLNSISKTCAVDQVRVNTPFLGGGLGRKIEQDYVFQAVQLSAMMGDALAKPVAVKLVWSREQDFANDRYRPSSVIRVRIGANRSDNKITSYIHRNVSPSIGLSKGGNLESGGDCAGAKGLLYSFGTRSIEHVSVSNGVPLGFWRSVGESYNTFAVESAIDELASALGFKTFAQSIQFRRLNLPAKGSSDEATRSHNVLDALEGMVPASLPRGSALGMAFMEGFESYIAMAVQVSGTTSSSKVDRVFIALDCGLRINPDSIRAQIEGGAVHGISAVLWGRMTFASGLPSANNFDRYRLARMPETPPVETVFVNHPDDPAKTSSKSNPNDTQTVFFAPGGVGETSVPVVAPALANAYARLTGVRKVDLPLN